MLSRTRIKVLWSLAVFAIGVVSLVRSETVKHAFLDDSEHVHLSIEDQGDNADVESKSILGHKKWTYLSNDDINKFIFNIHIKYPNMTRFYSIGNSVQHKTMWVLVLSDSPMQRPLTRPMFKYTANIHGNEPLGRQLLVYLAEYLLQNYGKATRITRLLNSVEIHLLFSANPDGFTNAIEGDCSGNDSHLARNNSYQIDLDTDFPFSTSVRQHLPDMLANRQPETVSLMSWIVSNPFVLSGSLHSGIFLISYPFDYSRPGTHPPASVDNPTPDNDVFISLAAGFAESRKALQENSFCYDTQVTNITNGARFSQVTGSMQDFNYLFSNCFELTIGLSCCKHPLKSELKIHWKNNRESLISFIEKIHMGIKGVARDAKLNKPIENVYVKVKGIESNVTTNSRGEFWRLLLPGKYEITFEAVGYHKKTLHAIVIKNKSLKNAKLIDISLVPVHLSNSNNKTINYDLKPNKQRIDFDEIQDFDEEQLSQNPNIKLHLLKRDFVTKPEFKHHDEFELQHFLEKYHKMYPNLTRLYSIGTSALGRPLWVLEISDHPGIHEPGEPEFKYVGNIHGNEVVGREMLLLFVQSILENYERNATIRWIVDNTRIHIMPSANPDGYNKSVVGDCDTETGRRNARGVDLNRNFPDQFRHSSRFRHYQPETRALMEWIKSYPFVLSISFHGGALVANYPFDGNIQNRDHQYTPTPDDLVFRHLATTYAKAHETMYKGQSCESVCNTAVPDDNFPNGITNGAYWYVLYGGMQDFNYLQTNCFEITVELGCYMYPYVEDLPKYWNENRIALFNFIMEAHKGIRGFVSDATGKAIKNAYIGIVGVEHYVKTSKSGDYWRLLLPGNYTITVRANGFVKQTQLVSVTSEMAVQVNFTLRRDSSKKSASIVTVHNRLESSASSSRFESWLMYTVTTALAMLVIGSCVYHVIIYCRYYKHGFQKLNTSIFFDAYDSKQKLMRSSFKQGYNSASSDEDVEDYSLYNVGHWQCEKPTSY